jgi:hypothetical protein
MFLVARVSPLKFQQDFLLVSNNELTDSLMELSPSWEAANCAAIQDILSI